MLNENAVFLSKEQLNQHVSKLNRNDFQTLDTEWEVAVLNAFSKMGSVTHEPELEGSGKLDLLFTKDGLSFLADITSVSDDGFEDKNPFKAFSSDLKERLKKAGLLYKGWSLSVGELPIEYGEPRKLALPLRAEFDKEIFNSNFKKFLADIKDHPKQSHTYRVHTVKTSISLSYNPNSHYFNTDLPVYNSALVKDQNPVFNALRSKAKQHKKVSFEGARGIILCDGSSDMFNNQPTGAPRSNFNAVDATKDFLRQNQSIDFVVILSSVQANEARSSFLDRKTVRKIQVTIVRNKNFENLDDKLKKHLENLEQYFPELINTAYGARETIRRGIDPIALRPLAGGIGVKDKEVRISASSVLSLLAGKITQEELFKSLGLPNSFEYFLSKRMRIVEIKIEDTIKDDSTLVIKFDGPDPAISLYTNPKDI